MKRNILVVLMVIVFILSFAPVVVAQTDPTTPTSTTTTPTTTPTKTLAQRIEEYKAKIQLKLTTADKTRLKARCKAAQVIIKQRQVALDKVSGARLNAYEKINKKLEDIIKQLDNQNVDTTKLKEEQKALELKINTFKSDIDTYKQALADTAELDCEADPTAFKSALQTARNSHQKVTQDAKDIRTYITESIIKTLNDIQAKLNSNSTNGGN